MVVIHLIPAKGTQGRAATAQGELTIDNGVSGSRIKCEGIVLVARVPFNTAAQAEKNLVDFERCTHT
eukprot:1161659-Pelagomonas_calceolata.AAC.26